MIGLIIGRTSGNVSARLELSNYEIHIEYSQNLISKANFTTPRYVSEPILNGDYLYIDEINQLFLIATIDFIKGEIQFGSILNLWTQALCVAKSEVIPSASKQLYDLFTDENYKTTNCDSLIRWSSVITSNDEVDLKYGDSEQNIISAYNYASKLLTFGDYKKNRSVLYFDNLQIGTPAKITGHINIKPSTEANSKVLQFIYTENPDTNSRNRNFIQSVKVNDKELNYNACIIYNKSDMSYNSTWYLHNDGTVDDSFNVKDVEIPVQYTGVILDDTAETPQDPQTLATGQLPVNQKNNFSFVLNNSDKLFNYSDLLPNAMVSIDWTDYYNLAASNRNREIKGIITDLCIKENTFEITCGLAEAKLLLSKKVKGG